MAAARRGMMATLVGWVRVGHDGNAGGMGACSAVWWRRLAHTETHHDMREGIHLREVAHGTAQRSAAQGRYRHCGCCIREIIADAFLYSALSGPGREDSSCLSI